MHFLCSSGATVFNKYLIISHINFLFSILVILVTAQLLVFGYYRYAHSNYYSDNRIGFEHLFLGKLWDPVREIDTYPPSTGALAIYDKVCKSSNSIKWIVKKYFDI